MIPRLHRSLAGSPQRWRRAQATSLTRWRGEIAGALSAAQFPCFCDEPPGSGVQRTGFSTRHHSRKPKHAVVQPGGVAAHPWQAHHLVTLGYDWLRPLKQLPTVSDLILAREYSDSRPTFQEQQKLHYGHFTTSTRQSNLKHLHPTSYSSLPDPPK